MKKIVYILLVSLVFASCSESFLEETPIGELTPEQILTPENIEGTVISAYAVLNGQFDEASNAFNSPASNWNFGDVVSDDAYKGGGGTGDQNQIHLMEIFATDPTVMDIERKWLALYEGIRRANNAIRLLNESEDFDSSLKAQRIAEMQFLRGHYHFEAKKIYGNICWIDETVETKEQFYNISNTDLSSDEQWGKIEADFTAAYNTLPNSQDDPGVQLKWLLKLIWRNATFLKTNGARQKVLLMRLLILGNTIWNLILRVFFYRKMTMDKKLFFQFNKL